MFRSYDDDSFGVSVLSFLINSALLGGMWYSGYKNGQKDTLQECMNKANETEIANLKAMVAKFNQLR